jgi:hypothetical protein
VGRAELSGNERSMVALPVPEQACLNIDSLKRLARVVYEIMAVRASQDDVSLANSL